MVNGSTEAAVSDCYCLGLAPRVGYHGLPGCTVNWDRPCRAELPKCDPGWAQLIKLLAGLSYVSGEAVASFKVCLTTAICIPVLSLFVKAPGSWMMAATKAATELSTYVDLSQLFLRLKVSTISGDAVADETGWISQVENMKTDWWLYLWLLCFCLSKFFLHSLSF